MFDYFQINEMLIFLSLFRGLIAEYGDCVCSTFHQYLSLQPRKYWMLPAKDCSNHSQRLQLKV